MMRIILFFILTCSHSWALGKNVRVLLDQSPQAPMFSFLGPTEFATPTQKISIYESNFKTKISQYKKGWALHIKTKHFSDKYYLKGEKLIVSSLAAIEWKQQSLDFKVQLVQIEQQYLVIGEMSMDRYLSGVIPREMPSSWPKEALKAQVVASRSYAYWKMRSHKNKAYDLKPSVMDQVFQLNRWGESTSLPVNVDEAIRQTSGEVLLESTQKVLKAYFHSDCGGSTTTTEAAWGEPGALNVAVKDPYCQSRSSEWSSQWSQTQLQTRLSQQLILPPQSRLKDILVRKQKDSDRVESVDFLFLNGIFKRLKGEDFRQLLGYDKIKSTSFRVVKVASDWIFAGRGFGHGVGMCQHGAKSMAKIGLTYRQILTHYYPQATIRGVDLDSVLLSDIQDY